MSVFFDANVLLYADDLSAGARTQIARELIRPRVADRTGVVSTQVLQEYYVNARKKLKMDGAAARARVELYSGLEVVEIRSALILAAIDLHRLHALSFWDALIVCAAQHAACETLYSEDLQEGRRFGQLRVVNPFA